jgi:hypothetical protein
MLTETDNLAAAAPPEEQKRNSGRSGPTSLEGKAISSQNATKHGACSKTLILPNESEEDWLLLLARWRDTYQPTDESLEFDFVLKAAQAEWYRLRAQRNYDEFLLSMGGKPPHSWNPADVKTHDLSLRYRTSAERAFQREYRLLEQHLKTHPTAKPRRPAPLVQQITVSIVDGKPRIRTPLGSEMIQKWCDLADSGDCLQRVFTFPDGVPREFAWMFPDPVARVPGAVFEQDIVYGRWQKLQIAQKLYPSGVPVEVIY